MRNLSLALITGLLVACSSSPLTQTEEVPVVFNKTFVANDVEVIAPNLIEISTTFNGKTENAVFTFEIPEVEFGVEKNVSCNGVNTESCQRLRKHLEEKLIQVNLKGHDRDSNYFTGELFVDGNDLVHHMISSGWYKFDYRQTRNKYLVILQKRAKCTGKGIWKNSQSTLTDLECN